MTENSMKFDKETSNKDSCQDMSEDGSCNSKVGISSGNQQNILHPNRRYCSKNVSHPGSFIPWRIPPSWLHTIICSCKDNSTCPMKHGISRRKPPFLMHLEME